MAKDSTKNAKPEELKLRVELILQEEKLVQLNQGLIGRIPSGNQYRNALAEIAKTEIRIKQLKIEIEKLVIARTPKKSTARTNVASQTAGSIETRPPDKTFVLNPLDVTNVNLTATIGEEQELLDGSTVIVYTEDSGAVSVSTPEGNLILSFPAPAGPEPTTYGTGVHQGIIEGSIIAVTNKKRTHECDISLFVMKEKALAGVAMKIVKELRIAIAAIIAFFGINPGSSGIIETIKQIKAWVDDIREFLEDVVLKIAEYLAIVQKIGALIQYILSLPAEILAYFKSCLTQLYAELKRQFLDAVAAVSDEFSTGDNDTINEAKKLLASTKKLIQQTASTVQVVQSLPAATLSKITNPGTKPLTTEEASNLAKDLLPTPATTPKYEAA